MLHLAALVARKSGDAGAAEQLFVAAHSAAPRDAQVLNNHANFCGDQGRKADALALYDKALALRPDFTEAAFNRALTLTDLEQYTEARRAFAALEAKAGDLRDAAAVRQFRQQVLDGGWSVEPDWAHPHAFEPGRYPAPAGSRYAGRYEFRKHYYPVLADLKDDGEEFLCAQLIDLHPKVRHWVRNLTSAPAGFALPTSRGSFYADFVAELTDDRVALLEYKGAHLANDPGEIEKRQIGELWARQSDGKAVFGWLMLTQGGKSLAQQLDEVLV